MWSCPLDGGANVKHGLRQLQSFGVMLFLGGIINIVFLAIHMHFQVQYNPFGEKPVSFRAALSVLPLDFVFIAVGSVLSSSSYLDGLRRRGLGILDFKKLLAMMTLSGGSVYADAPSHKYCLRYYGKSLVLHNIFAKLLAYTYGVKASLFEARNTYMTQVYNKKVVEDLFCLSPSYTTRQNHNRLQYNGGVAVIPSIGFLANASRPLSEEAVRLVASDNGSLYYSVQPRGKQYFVRPRLGLGYTMPESLLREYETLLRRIGIEMFPTYDRRFEKRGFLLTHSLNAVKAFAGLGGFIQGAKICRGRFRDVDKNILLKSLLDLHNSEENSHNSVEAAHRKVSELVSRYLQPYEPYHH